MLFSFPPEALRCNWVNQKVIEVLNAGMVAVDAGHAQHEWPDCLPADKRDVLRRRTGLQPKLASFLDEYSKLSAAEKTCLRGAIGNQTNLPNIYSDVTLQCLCFNDLPDTMQKPVKTLFEYLFGQLGKIKEEGKALRDLHFEICQDHGVRICPYCGLDYFQPVGGKRNALDHLMPISKYPFASADFRNLPPACHPCNSLYKLDQDILVDAAGLRRLCSDPYAGPTYHIKLDGSVFGEGNVVNGFTLPQWQIDIEGPSAHQAETWDAVYQIKSRFASILDADFLSWVKSFALWFVREPDLGRGRSPDEILAELPRYIHNVIQDDLKDRAFLKAEVFRLLERSGLDEAAGDDVKYWLWSQVEYST